MLCDFHFHTEFSADSETPVRSQLDRAIALGMKEVCVTDHQDYDSRLPDNIFVMDLDHYYASMREYQQEYAGRLRMNIGLELGLLIHEKEELSRQAAAHPYDFIIGSSHFVDGIDVYYPEFYEGRSERESYDHYFDVTLKRVRELDYFDVLGHLDFVVRYGPNRNQHYSYEAYKEQIDPILKCLIEKGKGLECNTGGLKYGLGHTNPPADVFKRYRELGGEIVTVGSDAHVPEYVGYEFERVQEMLKGCGFKYYAVFHERKPEFFVL